MKNFAIIIPVYNEEELMTKNAINLINFLDQKKSKNYEIIIGNNGSIDATLRKGKELAKRFPKKVKFFSINKKGVGLVFKKAVKLSEYNNIISQDMDLSTDLKFIPEALKLMENYDIVIGSKKMGSQKRSFFRKIPSAIFTFLVKIILKLPYEDYSMAAKAYKKQTIVKHIGKIDYGTSYVIDLIYYAKKDNKKIIEIPVKCIDKRKSKFNLLRESIYRFKNLIRLAIK